MTQHEFETRTGMSVDSATFSHAEDIYLNAGSLTKDEVCKEIKEQPWLLASDVVAALVERAQEQARLAAIRLADIEKLKAALLDAAMMAGDDTTWKGVNELVGQAAAIRYKFDNGCDLTDADVAYIKENLQ